MRSSGCVNGEGILEKGSETRWRRKAGEIRHKRQGEDEKWIEEIVARRRRARVAQRGQQGRKKNESDSEHFRSPEALHAEDFERGKRTG